MSLSKYRNRKITRDGMVFDSLKEYRRFVELSLLEKAGAITQLERQKKFVLIPAQYEAFERYSEKTGKRLKDGKRLLEKECAYYADFCYVENGKTVVEDVKSKATKTKDYRIKKKLLLYIRGIKIKEV